MFPLVRKTLLESPQKFSSCFRRNQWAFPIGFGGQCSDSWLSGRCAKCSYSQSHESYSVTSLLLKCLNIFAVWPLIFAWVAIPAEKSESSRQDLHFCLIQGNSKDYHAEYQENGLSCCFQADSTLKYPSHIRCTPGSNAELKDRNCSEILLTKGITVIKWTTECNFVWRNKGKETKKETTSHERREFPVLSEGKFGLQWRLAEVSEARWTSNDTCYFFYSFFLVQDFMLGLVFNPDTLCSLVPFTAKGADRLYSNANREHSTCIRQSI